MVEDFKMKIINSIDSDWREEVKYCFHFAVCFIYAINDFVICVLLIS